MKKKHCNHCTFINNLFPNANEMTGREYFIYTEVFLYLHGVDYCDGYENPELLSE